METQSELEAAQPTQEPLSATLEAILELQQKNSRQLVQCLRENVNFQNQVRLGMQRELEGLKEQQRGEQFTPILKAVAAVCVEYRKLLTDEAVPRRTRRTLRLMFEELEDILADMSADQAIPSDSQKNAHWTERPVPHPDPSEYPPAFPP